VKNVKLFEYEAKRIFKRYGIPVPRGELAASPQEARQVASKLSFPVAIKAQVLVSGRGKAGGILFAKTPLEVEEITAEILSMHIKGLKVKKVWIEEKIPTKKELFFSITIDRVKQSYVALASSIGGVDIEEIVEKMPEKLVKCPINPKYGFRSFHARQVASKIGYTGAQQTKLAILFKKLYSITEELDAELVEMNPLVETSNGEFIAVDARIIIDDNALFRHPEYRSRLFEEKTSEFSPEELKALEKGLAYVKLDGNIGIIGNGAGLVMATLDAVQHYGGKPANFLDVGGGASAEQITAAMEIVTSNPNVDVIFINILGGITRCDEVAKGIIEARKRVCYEKPMVIRLVGTNEEEGKRLLSEASIHVLESMEEAAEKAVQIAREVS
jgi:succinyl-CoA synthetase beta subunit